jgi:hypothetical protein
VLEHQLRLIARHTRKAVSLWQRLDSLGLGFLAGAAVLVLVAARFRAAVTEPWVWAWVGVAVPLGLLVPVYPPQLRYCYVVYPFLWVLTHGLWSRCSWPVLSAPLRQGWLLAVLLASFALPNVKMCYGAWRSPRTDALWPHVWADHLRREQVTGPIVGDQGLWLAYFLKTAWYGRPADPPSASANDYLQSGASVILVPTGSGSASELAVHPGVVELSLPAGFSAGTREECLFRVFRITQPSEGTGDGAPPVAH